MDSYEWFDLRLKPLLVGVDDFNEFKAAIVKSFEDQGEYDIDACKGALVRAIVNAGYEPGEREISDEILWYFNFMNDYDNKELLELVYRQGQRMTSVGYAGRVKNNTESGDDD